jgi:nicotinate-nucleotide pyrophosphorylase (carboxylating)
MFQSYGQPNVVAIIEAALREDLRFGDDLTCRTLVPVEAQLEGVIRAKATGVVCGLPIFGHVFTALGGGVEILQIAEDGTAVVPGDVVFTCRGNARVMLKGERTGLNFCQRLSGTASMARTYVSAVAGTKAKVFDTRKTTPGLRILEKHAVVVGGACNHRIGLYDQVLIKENHIALMSMGPTVSGQGDYYNGFSKPAEAVRRCRAALGAKVLIEVEIEELWDLESVIEAGADIVLLDNMGPRLLEQAVSMRGDRPVQLEASGNITLDTIRAVAETGVDRISTGALTHSVQALDLSMRCSPVR